MSAKLSAPFDFCYLGLSCVVMSIEGAKAFCFCSDLIFVSILHLKCLGSMNPRLQYELDLKINIYFRKLWFVETASKVDWKEMLTFGSFVVSRKPDVCKGDKQILVSGTFKYFPRTLIFY